MATLRAVVTLESIKDQWELESIMEQIRAIAYVADVQVSTKH